MTDGIVITRTFAAPRELVFEAWTTPEHFSVWFGSSQVEVPLDSLEMDVRVGGSWKATMVLPDGNTINWVGEYLEVDPPSRLVMTLTDNPSKPEREPVTVDLKEVEGGTEMHMTQAAAGFSDEQIAMTVMGYNAFLDDMEKIVTR